MAIEKMTLVNIDGNMESIDDAILECAKSGKFHPEQNITSSDSGFSVYTQSNPYESLLKKMSEIGNHAGINLNLIENISIDALHLNYIDDLSNKIQHIKKHKKDIISLLKTFENINADSDCVFGYKCIKFRIGIISNRKLKKLNKNKIDGAICFSFPKDKKTSWHAYLTTESRVKEVDNKYVDYNFERIIVPEDCLVNMKSITEYELNKDDFNIDKDKLEDYIEKFDNRVLDLNKKKNALQTEVEQNEQALIQLSHIEGLDVTFQELFSCKYAKVRFGRLPKDSYNKLKYYDEKVFVFCTFDSDPEYYWGAYFVPVQYENDIDAVFASLFFERIYIPDYVQSTLEEAKTEVMQKLTEGQKLLEEINIELKRIINKRKIYFYWLYAKVKYLSDSFDMRKYITISDGIFHLIGFMQEDEAKKFKNKFEKFGENVSVTLKPADSEQKIIPPTKLKNNRFVQAFEMFTEMYGLPAYSDIDPTPFVAVTYTLLFGVMFGDVGQGIVIALLGLFLWKKKQFKLGRIMERIGCSAAFFGLIYGEVFGFEHVLDPMFNALGFSEKPIHIMNPSTTNMILIGAVLGGVLFIVCSMAINIYAGIKKHDLSGAIFSHNGVVGLALYLIILVGVGFTMLTEVKFFNPITIAIIILLVVVLFLKEVIHQFIHGQRKIKFEGGIGSFLLESFFELFEILLSFVTNTLSFLRVGGFVLSHAGMMSVVFALSAMVSGGGTSPMVVIFGNIFVMCLEGLIVGIQTLRLEFYEMFSRFMEGSGKEFEPIKIGKHIDL